jgi:hypothetical protein
MFFPKPLLPLVKTPTSTTKNGITCKLALEIGTIRKIPEYF